MTPPLITTSIPGTIGHEVVALRIPRIVAEMIAENDFSTEVVVKLNALVEESQTGTIQADESDPWNPAQYAGKTWHDVPFYWVESWFYHRVRTIVGADVDPFAVKKRKEWHAALPFIAQTLTTAPLTEESFTSLLHASLWGNRFDLSHAMSQPIHAETDNTNLLLVDDTAAVWQHLQVKGSNRVAVLGDNCGADLAGDLLLIDHLFQGDLAHSAMIWLKNEPFYISDAMIKDIVVALEVFDAAEDAATREFSARIRTYLKQRRLILRSHPFFTSQHCYDALPEQLAKNLVGFDLTIVKGDLHYRRLLQDRDWPVDTAFQDIVKDYPAPLVALRTLKSNVIAGITQDMATQLATEDKDWLINGKRGTIQFRA